MLPSQVHFPFMRQSMGVRKSTSTAVMMEELHRDPLAFHWLRMAVQLWNKALGRPAGDYLRLAMEDNVQLSGQASGAAASQLWAHHFTQAMDALGCQWKGGAGLMKVNPADVQQAMRDKWVDWEWRAVNAGTTGGRAQLAQLLPPQVQAMVARKTPGGRGRGWGRGRGTGTEK